jgi:predicted RNase H-like HicB family nuclease
MELKMKKIIKTKDYKFMAVIKPAEEGGFYAYCPLLPGCTTQGETYAETVANIEDAIQGYIEVMLEVGDLIPQDAIVDEGYILDVPVNLPVGLSVA